MCVRGVVSGTASRALALLDFWLAGPIKPTFQRVFLAPLLDYWLTGAITHQVFPTRIDSGHGQTVAARALISGPIRFYRLATPLCVAGSGTRAVAIACAGYSGACGTGVMWFTLAAACTRLTLYGSSASMADDGPAPKKVRRQKHATMEYNRAHSSCD